MPVVPWVISLNFKPSDHINPMVCCTCRTASFTLEWMEQACALSTISINTKLFTLLFVSNEHPSDSVAYCILKSVGSAVLPTWLRMKMKTTTHRNCSGERTSETEMGKLIVWRLEKHSSSSWSASTENENKHINCSWCKCMHVPRFLCRFVCLFWPSLKIVFFCSVEQRNFLRESSKLRCRESSRSISMVHFRSVAAQTYTNFRPRQIEVNRIFPRTVAEIAQHKTAANVSTHRCR